MALVSDIGGSLGILVLSVGRTLPMAWMLPVFGGPAVPLPIRLGIGLGLGLLSYPLVAVHAPPDGAPGWSVTVLQEVMIGAVMALVIACFFRAVEAAGGMTDVLRGGNHPQSVTPVSAEDSTPMGSLFLLLSVVAFWEIGGLRYLALALARSYEAIPVGASALSNARGFALLVVKASAKLIESSVALAAPVVVASLIADLLLGALGRAAPNLPLPSLGMPAKALLGVGLVLLGFGIFDVAITTGLHEFLSLLSRTSLVY